MRFIIATTTLLTGLTALPSDFSYFADQNNLISPGPNAPQPQAAPGPDGQQAPIAPNLNNGQPPSPTDPSKQSGDGKTDRFWGGYYPWRGYYPWGGYYPWNGYYPYYPYNPYGPYWRSNVAEGADKAEGIENNKPSA